MNNTIKKTALIVALAAVGLVAAAGAQARGLIGDIVNVFVPDGGDIGPSGGGEVRCLVGIPPHCGFPIQLPSPRPDRIVCIVAGPPCDLPEPRFVQQPQIGKYCELNGGRFGPGPTQPVGNRCPAWTFPNGVTLWGEIVQ